MTRGAPRRAAGRWLPALGLLAAHATCARGPAIVLPPPKPGGQGQSGTAAAGPGQTSSRASVGQQPAAGSPSEGPAAPAGGAQAAAGQAFRDPYLAQGGRLTASGPAPSGAALEGAPAQPEQLAAEQQRLRDQARGLYERAVVLHRGGQYQPAEQLLTEALTLYPFQVEVNLLLGKIYLLKGYANRDPAMLQTARLMFEMASALEPELAEPRLLLQLFSRPEGSSLRRRD